MAIQFSTPEIEVVIHGERCAVASIRFNEEQAVPAIVGPGHTIGRSRETVEVEVEILARISPDTAADMREEWGKSDSPVGSVGLAGSGGNRHRVGLLESQVAALKKENQRLQRELAIQTLDSLPDEIPDELPEE